MHYGYKVKVGGSIVQEIAFAKEHFDFVEITLQLQSLHGIRKTADDLALALGQFPVIGHLHWTIDLSQATFPFDEIKRQVLLTKMVGGKAVVIHPSANVGQTTATTISNNCRALQDVSAFCRENALLLLIENINKDPFRTAAGMGELLRSVSEASLCLDVGHANRVSDTALAEFAAQLGPAIRHVHLHDNVGRIDHLFFQQKRKLETVLQTIRSSGYDSTITFEMFEKIEGDHPVSLDMTSRFQAMLQMLDMLRCT